VGIWCRGSDADSVEVEWRVGDEPVERIDVECGSMFECRYFWAKRTFSEPGEHEFTVRVDPRDLHPETTDANNEGSLRVIIDPAPGAP
jgi:hypothetical protein